MASFEEMLNIGEMALEGFPENFRSGEFKTFSGKVVPKQINRFKVVSVTLKVYETVESSDNITYFLSENHNQT